MLKSFIDMNFYTFNYN